MKDRRLHPYHDGELSPGAEARAARTLERSPEDRAELARLAAVGDWVREADAAGGGDVPDLWDGIAARLPAIDAERAEAQAARSWWWRPLLAGAAATAATAAVVLALFLRPVTGSADVVQWLDAEGAPVMVLDAEDGTTVIWVLEEEGGEETSGGGSRGLA
jgi:anti-sigma factor RsiW